MIRMLGVGLVSMGVALGAAGTAFAHHDAMKGYDAQSPAVVLGTITKVDWGGPHVQVHLKAKDGKTWSFQTAPPKDMRDNGLDEKSMGAGDVVTLRGYQSVDKACKPECLANGRDITFSEGVKVSFDGSTPKDKGKAVHDKRMAERAKLKS